MARFAHRRPHVLTHAKSASNQCNSLHHASARRAKARHSQHVHNVQEPDPSTVGAVTVVANEVSAPDAKAKGFNPATFAKVQAKIARGKLAYLAHKKVSLFAPVVEETVMADELSSHPELHFEGFEDAVPVAKGGMATIWKARQISLDRWVAIKVLALDQSTDDADIDQFQSEARTAAKLTHSGIVPVYDAFYRNDRFCLVMAFVDGYTISAWLESRGYLPVDDCLFVAKGVAEALAYAWNRQQLVHCDIKPENIMIDVDGSVKITDFGLSRSRSSFQSRKKTGGFVFGTPAYISPEQATASETLTVQTDMYSLGASLYYMCTGTRLFAGEPPDNVMNLQVNGQDDDPFERNTSLSPFFCGFIEKLLCKEPADRFSSWEEVLEEINNLHNNLPLSSGEINLATTRSTVTRSALREKARAEQMERLGLQVSVSSKRKIKPTLPEQATDITSEVYTVPEKAPAAPKRLISRKISRWIPSKHTLAQVITNRITLISCGVIAALLIGAVLTSHSKKVEEKRQAEMARAAQVELNEIDAFMRHYPHDYNRAISRCNQLVRTLENPAHAEIRRLAIDKTTTLEANRKEAIDRVMQNLREEVNPLIEQRQFIRAAAIIIGYDGPMADATRRTRQNLADHLNERATPAKRNRVQAATND